MEDNSWADRHPLLAIAVGVALVIGAIYAGAALISWLDPIVKSWWDAGIKRLID